MARSCHRLWDFRDSRDALSPDGDVRRPHRSGERWIIVRYAWEADDDECSAGRRQAGSSGPRLYITRFTLCVGPAAGGIGLEWLPVARGGEPSSLNRDMVETELLDCGPLRGGRGASIAFGFHWWNAGPLGCLLSMLLLLVVLALGVR